VSRLRNRIEAEDGFSLVEVIVAVGILAIAAVGIMPLVVSALKAAYSAKFQTQSKSLVQEQIDYMRSLPFHVDASNGPYRDLLDTYYPNTTAAASPAGSATARNVLGGYVTSSAVRAAGEPSGAFYRYVAPVDASFSSFRTVVDAQLLDKDLTVLLPPSGYDASLAGSDTSGARLIGITVINSWTVGGSLKTFRVYTQIADAKPAAPVINGSARAAAVSVVGSSSDGVKTNVVAGYIDESGSVSTGSVGSVKAVGAYIDRFPGTRLTGASALADAPPDVTTPLSQSDDLGQDLTPGTCALACIGRTYVSGVGVLVAQGLPTIASSSSPVIAALRGTGSPSGMSLNTDVDPTLAATLMLASGPKVLVRNTNSGADLAGSSGYLTSTTGSTHLVNTHVTSSGSLEVLPTTFTPVGRGVVEVVLTSSSVDCKANGISGGSTATAAFSATVYYWSAASGGYVALGTVQPGNTSDPLPAPSTLTVYSSGATTLRLSNYIADWHSALAGSFTTDTNGRFAQASLDGVVAVNTIDLRPGDTTSGVQAKLGALSCSAEDAR
jgi:prepilin-type N-terminal cleavage/methylation domain-containing protein